MGTHRAVEGTELSRVLVDHAVGLLRGPLALEGQHPVPILKLSPDVIECVPSSTRL